MHMPHRQYARFSAIDGLALLFLGGLLCLFFYRMETVLDYQWDWSVIPAYLIRKDAVSGLLKPNTLLLGFLTTLRISVWATLLAVIIGITLGLMRAYGNTGQRFIGWVYVEIIRNLPALVLVLIFYYLVSSQYLDTMGIDTWLRGQPPSVRRIAAFLFSDAARINAFFSAVVTLAIYEGAYITEIIRGGLSGIPHSQWETAYAQGLTPFQAFRYVILPQVVRNTLSPLTGQFISTIKDSAIMSVISIQELTFQGMELMSATFLTFEIWISITLLYFIVTFPLSRWTARFEKQLRTKST